MLDFVNPKIYAKGGIRSISGNPKPKTKSWKDIILDSIIIAGITFFSVWSGHINLEQLLTTLKATGLAFFLQVAYEKGIKKYNQR